VEGGGGGGSKEQGQQLGWWQGDAAPVAGHAGIFVQRSSCYPCYVPGHSWLAGCSKLDAGWLDAASLDWALVMQDPCAPVQGRALMVLHAVLHSLR
jgi:hypothetical protein